MSDETWGRVGREHEEHERQVRELTEALHAHPVDLPEVRRVVAAIDRDLPEHLRQEELVVLPWLTRVLPESAPEVEKLAHDHLQLFATITSLRFALGAQLGEPAAKGRGRATRPAPPVREEPAPERHPGGSGEAGVGPVATQALAFLAFFRDHLRREQALVERAIARGKVPLGQLAEPSIAPR